MTLWQNGVLRYCYFNDFWSIFEDRKANLGLIDSKIGLYIKVDVTAGPKTNSKSISTNLPKISINWHKIGQMPLWRHGNYLAITWSFFIQFGRFFF